MRFQEANEVLNLLTDRFESLCRTDADRERWRSEIMRFDAEPEVVARGVAALVNDWKPNRNPTRPEIAKYIERAKTDEAGRGKVRECYAEARAIRDRHGDRFLAMCAQPAQFVCQTCADDYVTRGVDIGHPLLRHTHFSLADLDHDPALELAVISAKQAVHHPLESIAQPRTQEQTSALIRRLGSFGDITKPVDFARKRPEATRCEAETTSESPEMQDASCAI